MNNTVNVSTSTLTEKAYQNFFYDELAAAGFDVRNVNMSTDGYTEDIFFEHKRNATAFGTQRAIGQAIIYMTKLNMRGIPVPAYIAIVSQSEHKIFVYKTIRYSDYINDIEKYSRNAASINAESIDAAEAFEIINYAETEDGWKELANRLKRFNGSFKVNINKYNVVGWSETYYRKYPNDRKDDFFCALRNPAGKLSKYINMWTGREEEFNEVMDQLNDKATQKKLGAFYTPERYAIDAARLLRDQISAWKEKYPDDDYLIIDRCAGSGNLEAVFMPDELSHFIINTYERKEWVALRYRIGEMVRELIPPIPERGEPESDGQFLVGSDALSEEFCVRLEESIKRNAQTEHYGIFFFENPPYTEAGAKQYKDSLDEEEKGKRAEWKDSFVVRKMKEAGVLGTATNDMANAFIWSAFNMFMHEEDDGYVVFSPIKYWKAQHMINKKFVNGFLANRAEFHASAGAISVISWKNEDSNIENFDLGIDGYVNQVEESNRDILEPIAKTITCERVYKTFAKTMYDKRKFDSDTEGIAGGCNGYGLDNAPRKISVNPKYNNNIVGYLVSDKTILTSQAAMDAALTTLGRFNGHGFYLREDNFVEKLPMFASGLYTEENKEWWMREFLMKTGDGLELFEEMIANGKADHFLKRCLIYTMFTNKTHLCSFIGSDNRKYENKLAPFQNTIGTHKLEELCAKCETSELETDIFNSWNSIFNEITQKEEYNPEFKYGLYQIEKEINVSIEDEFGNKFKKYGNLNNMITNFKKLVNKYYVEEVGPELIKYGFVK